MALFFCGPHLSRKFLEERIMTCSNTWGLQTLNIEYPPIFRRKGFHINKLLLESLPHWL